MPKGTPADGGGVGCRRHPAQPHPVQGQRRPDASLAGRPCDGRQRRCRLGQVRRRRPDAPAGGIWRPAHEALPQRAHRQGAGLQRGGQFALRPARPRAWTRP